jgi:uncharacterized protein (TIGR01619 family)
MSSATESVNADDWDFYFCNVNDVPSSLFVNLSAIRHAPRPDKPWLLWIWVHMRAARDDGFSSNEEAPALYDMEDKLTEILDAQCGAEMLGRITGDSRREFYYYAREGEGFESALERFRSGFPEYVIEHGIRRDAEWQQYLEVLYPSLADMQRIQNRRVLEQLKKQGDDHAVPRIVDHMLYFRTASDRAGFVDTAVKSGFRVQYEDHDAAEGCERPFSLNLTRTDPVTSNHIDDVVVELVQLAGRFGADYDGWGCEVQDPGSDVAH